MEEKKIGVKIILIGDCGVGKTHLIYKFTNKILDPNCPSAPSTAFIGKNVMIDGRTIQTQFWDTVEQERYRSISRVFYRGVDCCVFCFDVNNEKSFINLDNWKNEFEKHKTSKTNLQYVLIGNKTDLNKGVISRERAELWCETNSNSGNKIIYFETSVKNNENIQEPFITIAKLALKHYDTEQITTSSSQSNNIENEQYPPNTYC